MLKNILRLSAGDYLALGGGVLAAFLFAHELTKFPIYFFCDEAIHGLEAESLLQTGRDLHGKALPVFLRGFGDFQLSLSVYLQIPFIWIFGLNEVGVRARNVFFGLIGLLLCYLLLRDFFQRKRFAWLVVPLMALSPHWFLHARSGFEALPAVVFSLLFLYSYLCWLGGDRRFLLPAVLAAAASFYTYTPARGWILLLAGALFLVNAKHHLRRLKDTGTAALLFVICLLPAIILLVDRPDQFFSRLNSLGGPLLDEPLSAQFMRMAEQYLSSLDPRLWFLPYGRFHESYSERHSIPELGLYPIWLLPFWVFGAVSALMKLHHTPHRSLAAFLLVVPIPASLVSFDSLRVMPIGVIYLLLAVEGAAVVLLFLSGAGRFFGILASALTASFLLSYSLWFSHYVYEVAPARYRDYRFFGVQYGAPQLFHWIQTAGISEERIVISPDLFNRGDTIRDFYLGRDSEVLIHHQSPCEPSLRPERELFVLPADRLAFFAESGCPLEIHEIRNFRAPNGRLLFSAVNFVRRGST